MRLHWLEANGETVLMRGANPDLALMKAKGDGLLPLVQDIYAAPIAEYVAHRIPVTFIGRTLDVDEADAVRRIVRLGMVN